MWALVVFAVYIAYNGILHLKLQTNELFILINKKGNNYGPSNYSYR